MRNTLKCLAVIAALSASLAAQGGSDTKDKFFFKKSCKSCHSAGGSAKEITPLSKTQAQWKAYFRRRQAQEGRREDRLHRETRAGQGRADLPREPRLRLPAARDLRRLIVVPRGHRTLPLPPHPGETHHEL